MPEEVRRLEHHLRQLLKAQRRAINAGDQALKEHTDQQVKSVSEALTRADALEKERIENVEKLIGNEIATTEAARKRLETETDRRFGEVEKTAGEALTEEQYEVKHEALIKRIGDLERWQSNMMGRMVGVGLIGAVFIAVVVAVITHLFA